MQSRSEHEELKSSRSIQTQLQDHGHEQSQAANKQLGEQAMASKQLGEQAKHIVDLKSVESNVDVVQVVELHEQEQEHRRDSDDTATATTTQRQRPRRLPLRQRRRPDGRSASGPGIQKVQPPASTAPSMPRTPKARQLTLTVHPPACAK